MVHTSVDAGSSSSTGGGSGGSSSRKTPRKVTKKNTATTLKAVMAQYPELKSLSSEQRALQYKAYVLHMNGATSEERDKLKPVTFGWFYCCKDGNGSTSAGCKWDDSGNFYYGGYKPLFPLIYHLKKKMIKNFYLHNILRIFHCLFQVSLHTDHIPLD